jgi:PPM family protein phosphatase
VRTFGLTNRGRVRASNEDQFFIAELTKSMKVLHASLPQPKTQRSDERGYLFIVADGMGGHQAGEHASAMAVESIEAFALNTLRWFFLLHGTEEHNVLKEFKPRCSRPTPNFARRAAQHRELAGMGTTLTIAYSVGSRLFVVHVGDSRCYLLHGSELQRLMHDHTVVAELISRGVLQPREATRVSSFS